MYQQFVKPSSSAADIIVSGVKDLDGETDRVLGACKG